MDIANNHIDGDTDTKDQNDMIAYTAGLLSGMFLSIFAFVPLCYVPFLKKDSYRKNYIYGVVPSILIFGVFFVVFVVSLFRARTVA